MEATVGLPLQATTGALLWQPSYFDRVMRNDEDIWKTVQYVLENPVRKGLVENFADYPFSGSDVFTMEQMKDLWQRQD